MSQPALVLVLAAATAAAATAAIARAASARLSRRALSSRLLMVGVAFSSFSYVVTVIGIRLNFTPSMPLGIYRFMELSPHEIRRGMLVAVCAPLDASKLGRRRGYLSGGACVGNSEPLLKTVAAVGGDVVAVSPIGVSVNGCLLADSKPLRFDRAGRPMASWPVGRHRVSRGSIWLSAANERSWDSRYWGPAPAGNVSAVVAPLLAVGDIGSAARDRSMFAVPPCGRRSRAAVRRASLASHPRPTSGLRGSHFTCYGAGRADPRYPDPSGYAVVARHS
jgi:conjugative transfer signal peptidase TraF